MWNIKQNTIIEFESSKTWIKYQGKLLKKDYPDSQGVKSEKGKLKSIEFAACPKMCSISLLTFYYGLWQKKFKKSITLQGNSDHEKHPVSILLHSKECIQTYLRTTQRFNLRQSFWTANREESWKYSRSSYFFPLVQTWQSLFLNANRQGMAVFLVP